MKLVLIPQVEIEVEVLPRPGMTRDRQIEILTEDIEIVLRWAIKGEDWGAEITFGDWGSRLG